MQTHIYASSFIVERKCENYMDNGGGGVGSYNLQFSYVKYILISTKIGQASGLILTRQGCGEEIRVFLDPLLF